MNKKMLIGVFLGLLLLVLLSDKKQVKKTNTRVIPVVQGFTPESVVKIGIISRENDQTRLALSGGTWQVETKSSFPADAEKVARFLQDIFLLKLGERVTSGQEQFDKYGLATTSKPAPIQIALTGTEGSKKAQYFFGIERMSKGKFGFDSPSGQYFRREGEDVVYLLKDKFPVETIQDNWLLKKLPQIKEDQIASINFGGSSPKAFELNRLKKEDPLVLKGLKDTEEMDAAEVKKLGELFGNFTFTKLVKPDSADAQKSMTSPFDVVIRTFSGMKYSIAMGANTTPSNTRFAQLGFESIGAEGAAKKEVQTYQSRFKDWMIGLSDYAGRRLIKTRTDFVKFKPLGARHILISYTGSSAGKAVKRTKEDAKILAESIIQELQAGKDFAELAKAHSDDTSNASNGGDLGTFKKGDMVKPFEMATMNLKVGEVTETPVETVFGFHIIKRTQ